MTSVSSVRLSAQENRVSRNTFGDLRSPGIFAKWPMIGITMFILGSLVFGALVYNVRGNEHLIQWDIATAKTLHADALNIPSAVVEYLIFGFFVGREIIIF